MSIFINKRIESPFGEMFKGFNQYIVSGRIDDLFLMESANGDGPKLRRIADAYVEYGKREQYDFVIIINEDVKLSFATPEQEEKFNAVTRGDSSALVEEGHKAKKFQRRNRAESSPSNGSSQNANSQNTDAQVAAAQAGQQARDEVYQIGSDANNRLGLVTRILKDSAFRSLVIFPHPEKMVAGNQADGSSLQRIETIVKEWRDIIQEAHPDSRSILIVNPHRLKDFHYVEQVISCYDHNCKEITIQQPPIEEMRAWLQDYAIENNIQGTSREFERVVLTGRVNAGENLMNFISWVQSFFQKNPNQRSWTALLARENQEAAESKEDLLEKLDEMIGLSEVKKEIHSIVESAEKNNATASDATYHMFFLGNPGTGKTVVANIVAKLFWAMELRTSKKVVNVAIHDIVSQYNEGDTLQKMKSKVQEAMGGVLFIDEAYLFAESEWGKKAFQVLLTEMENNRKNLTVILAGYQERLQALKDVNPGIDSRIPHKLHFRDYSKDEKLEIFKLHLNAENQKTGLNQKLSADAEKKLLRVLDRTEGNGRGVRSNLETTLKNANGASTILEQHIHNPHEIHSEEAEKILAELNDAFIGMESVKKSLRDYFLRVKWNVERAQELELTNLNNFAYRIKFVGPPGTGKTSVARFMGRFFHAMGLSETDECHECGATSLKGAYLGHAQQAVNNLFHENRGKVIFIDEIYSLYNPTANQDDAFSREVIDTLVRCLTAEEYQSTVVIVAGYKDKVNLFLEANPGLASRIPDTIEFSNYTAEECLEIFKSYAQKRLYNVDSECDEPLIAYFNSYNQDENFGNARFVGSTFSMVESNVISRCSNKSDLTREDYTTITKDDIPTCKRANHEV